MHQFRIISALLVSFVTSPASAQELAGVWVGGTNATGHWFFAEARFEHSAAGVGGTLAVVGANAAGLPIDHVTTDGDHITFRVPTPLGEIAFDGLRTNDVIDGAVTGAAPGARLHLVHVDIPRTEQADAAVGNFELGLNRELLLTYRAFGFLTGIVLERRDGHEFISRSFVAVPSGNDRYVTSGSIVQEVRRDETLTLERGENGTVIAIRWARPNAPVDRAPRIAGMKQTSIRFFGAVGALSGTLFLPASGAKHAAVVIVGGSGPTGRDANVLRAREFVGLGLAAITWDKRGVGESAGSYMNAGLDDLAVDAASALAFLATRPEVDASRIGITGHSQGGWIAPLAAAKSTKPPAWMVITSGGPITPAEQEAWRARTQTLAAGGSDADAAAAEAFMRRKWQYGYTGADWEGYISAAQQARGAKWGEVVDPMFVRDSSAWAFIRTSKDFDPLATPLRPSVPVLVLFGDHDDEQPVAQSKPAWVELFRHAGQTDHEIVVIPGTTHSLWLGTGNSRPLISTPTDIIGRWLSQHGVTQH